ncbi:MAG TPA: MOP flippase family protein [Candidatus Krumholzibacteria bacterium]|nr:MOP flippase family protein [Candidatus Krumholzibacteria bacterium]
MSTYPDVDMKHLRRRATSGARWTGSATGFRIGAQFVQLAVLARLLRVEDFGLMAMVNVVLAFAQTFADAGVSNAIIHYRDAKREELSSLYWLNLTAGVAVCVLTWFAAPLAAKIYRQPGLTELVRAASVVFIVGPLGQQFQVLMERDLRFRRLALIEVLAIGASALVGIGLALRGNGVWSLVWAVVVQQGLKALLLAMVGWSTWRPMLRFVPSECRRFLHFGLYQMGERSMNLLGQHVDKIIIGILMGPGPLGYYELAYRLIARPYQIINPIFTRVAFPVFSAVQSDRARLRKGYLELIETLGAVVIPLYVGLFALAPAFVRVQLGPDYEPTIPLLRILTAVGLFFSVTSPAGSLLLACGRADLGFYINILRTSLILVGIWIGARWGLVGIAWALVFVTTVFMFPVHVAVRRRLVGMTLAEFLARLLPFVWPSLAGAAVCLAAHRFVPWPNSLVELVVMLAVSGGIYLGWLLRQERPLLNRIVTLVRS